jgi:hypothetical protein
MVIAQNAKNQSLHLPLGIGRLQITLLVSSHLQFTLRFPMQENDNQERKWN